MAKLIGSLLMIGLIAVSWSQVEGALCPDQKTRCPTEETCCSDLKGAYGCCPYPNATCCADGNHCCPHATSCDMAHGRCVSNVIKPPTPWTIIYDSFTDEELLDTNAIGSGNSTELTQKKCPDGDKTCPDTYTCCNMASGGHGCCPFKDGVCCSDQVHCCSKGQTCDVKNGSCH